MKGAYNTMKSGVTIEDVMAAQFSVIDMNLYLDTHPCDAKALMQFANYARNACLVRNAYERAHGPLTAANAGGCPWQWVTTPWPWERQCD